MARQPLLPKYKGAGGYALGPGEVAIQRPHLAQIIGDCTAIWPYIEHDMSIALAGLLDTKSPAALGVFAALRGFRSQRDVLEGAAKAVLNADEVDLIAACLSAIWTAQRARDDIAHGLWGVLLEEPDLLLWIANADYAVWNAAAIAAGGGGDEHAELAKKLFVYTKRDLLMARDALMAARNVSFEMSMYCQWRPGRPQTREAIRDQLLKRPLVRQALDHLIAARSR